MHKAYKAFKAEFTCGLIGAIIGINAFFFASVFGGIAIGMLSGWGNEGLIVALALGMLFSLLSMILGFAGVSALNKNNKSGGNLVTVSGALSFLTLFLTSAGLSGAPDYVSIIGLVYFLMNAIPATALLLIGGIMALARKRPMPQPQTYPQSPYIPYPPQAPYVQPPYAPYPPPPDSSAPAPPAEPDHGQS
jgi:hypothetical protein